MEEVLLPGHEPPLRGVHLVDRLEDRTLRCVYMCVRGVLVPLVSAKPPSSSVRPSIRSRMRDACLSHLQRLNPAAVTRVVVDGRLAARVPGQQQERERLQTQCCRCVGSMMRRSTD